MQGPPLLQEAVVGVSPGLDLSLADPQQVVEQDVAVEDLELQHVALLAVEVVELLLPPGVRVAVPNGRLAQRGGAAEHLDVAVGDARDAGGEFGGPQVEDPQLGSGQSQTAQDQQQEGKTGRHGYRERCDRGGFVTKAAESVTDI